MKRFNQKCEAILAKGIAKGIVWNEIELIDIVPNKKNISIKYEDHSANVEITKLCINFFSNQSEFILVFNAVVEYDGQYLVSNGAVELDEVTK